MWLRQKMSCPPCLVELCQPHGNAAQLAVATLLSSPSMQVTFSFLGKVICEPMQPHGNLQGKCMRLKRGPRFGFRLPLLSRNKRHGEASAVAKGAFE